MRMRWIILLAVLSLAYGVLACSTPVFRYAIERWEADPYRLLIFADGELTDAQKQVVEDFKQYERYGFRQPPLIVDQFDTSSVTNLSATVWSILSTNHVAPAVALVYPSIMRDNSVVWADELSSNALNRIVMSPARLETATRLLGGDAAVWLLIGGNDLEENNAAREVLEFAHRKIETGTIYNEDFLKLVEESGGEAMRQRTLALWLFPSSGRGGQPSS